MYVCICLTTKHNKKRWKEKNSTRPHFLIYNFQFSKVVLLRNRNKKNRILLFIYV